MRQLNQALFRVKKLYGAPKALLLLCTTAICAMPMAAWAQSKSGASELPVASQDLASHNMDAHDVAPNKDAQAKSKTLVRIPALNPLILLLRMSVTTSILMEFVPISSLVIAKSLSFLNMESALNTV